MEQLPRSQSELDKATVKSWLSRLSLDYIHDTGWIEINRRNNAIALGSRTFANQQFPDQPERRTDFMDGVAFGLLAVAHTSDIADLRKLFEIPLETDALPEQSKVILPGMIIGDPGVAA